MQAKHLENKENSVKPQNNGKIKQRASITLALPPTLQLNSIQEEISETFLESIKGIRGVQELVDSATLEKLKMGKDLNLSILKGLSEEESLIRYTSDAFFRAKVNCELKCLSRRSSEASKKREKEDYDAEIPDWPKDDKITFRQYKESEQSFNIDRKVNLQKVMRRSSANDTVMRPHHF